MTLVLFEGLKVLDAMTFQAAWQAMSHLIALVKELCQLRAVSKDVEGLSDDICGFREVIASFP